MSTSICERLIHPNVEQLFAEHCEEIYRTWEELLRKTSLLDNATSTDSCVLSAIRAFDNMIKRPESQGVARLAYVQLIRVLADLRKKI
jgi:arsenate reductase-like glutaredoxin family protein